MWQACIWQKKNEKIPGTRNEYHIVKQKDYLLSDGIHEAIISEEMWNQAHRKRQETGVLQVKTHSLEHEHILSGIIKCPVCGSGMYGNVNRKKHPDGGYYKDYFIMPANTGSLWTDIAVHIKDSGMKTG